LKNSQHITADETHRFRSILIGAIVLWLGAFPSAGHAAEAMSVFTRLFESADRAERTDLRHAAIANQFRPVLEPADQLWLVRPKKRTHDGKAFLLSFEVPLYLNHRSALVEREFRRADEENWQTLPATVARVEHGTVLVRIPAPQGSTVRTRGSLSPLEPLDRTSQETLIPIGARLQGSIGLSALIPPERSTSVRFRIVALTENTSIPVHEFVLHPSTATREWTDYSIDLSKFSGQRLRFRLTTENLRGWPGKDLSLPLIGIPVLSAPTTFVRPNFILVSLDTLRADAVSVYGAERRATPNLDSFAKDAVTFLDASTTYPTTTASHMSLFTGLYPGAHQVLEWPTRLKPDVPTLPDLLAQAGYRTGAVTENGMLFANAGFVRGFDSYDEVTDKLREDTPGWAAEVVDRGIAWLQKYPQEQFFLFLHTYQVHEPYLAPEGYDQFPLPEDTPYRKYQQAYKAEVLYTDHQMGRLLAALKPLGLSQNTVVIFTSDHGEAFGEDGKLTHGYSLHEEAMRIPLLMRVPGRMQSGLRITAPVSLVDLLPTMTSLAGVSNPKILQGRSLLAAAAGQSDASLVDRKLYMQRRIPDNKGDQFAIRVGTQKWLIGPGIEDVERFELSRDPREENGITSDAIIETGADLLREYQQASQDIASSYGENAGASDLDAATRDRLRALGYIDVAESNTQP
jgi:arylsulfatase A-like enzyme